MLKRRIFTLLRTLPGGSSSRRPSLISAFEVAISVWPLAVRPATKPAIRHHVEAISGPMPSLRKGGDWYREMWAEGS